MDIPEWVGRVGFLGAGHLAGYLLEGLRRRRPDLPVALADLDPARARDLAGRWRAEVADGNQALVDPCDLVILAVRPPDALPVCRALAFRPGQVLASAAAGVGLDQLGPAVAPARAVRVMPLTSASLNLSPTLLFPDDPAARAVFALVGQVHPLPDEAAFTAASVIAAFYGWVYALADETVAWAARQGVPEGTAKEVVLGTIHSTVAMSLANGEVSLQELLARLATPGGITQLGLGVLRERHGLDAWTAALDAVLERVRR
jgi:pyrroline-5-carboxylate reductase